MGLMLLAISVFPNEGAGQVVPPTQQCTGSWGCMPANGQPVNGCNLGVGVRVPGRVPSCQAASTDVCLYNVPGYICNGTDITGAPCSVIYSGCQ